MGFQNLTSRFKKPSYWLPLSIAVLALAVILLVVHELSAPAVGRISQGQINLPKPDQAAKKLSLYNGQFVSFSYPSDFHLASKYQTPTLETALLAGPFGSMKHLALRVSKENLNDDSGVNYRRTSGLYHQVQSSDGSLIFVKNSNGFERTVFTAQGDLVCSLSLTDPSGNDYTDESNQITVSLKWK